MGCRRSGLEKRAERGAENRIARRRIQEAIDPIRDQEGRYCLQT